MIGIMGTASSRTSRPPERYFYARAIGLAMWCIARGYKMLGHEPARDGRGIVFLFPPSAADEVAHYFATKDTLNRLLVESQQP